MKPAKHQPAGPWRGVRTRRIAAAADPDSGLRQVTLPAAWDDAAAAAVAALAPGQGPVSLVDAAGSWLRPLAARARQAGLAEDPAVALEPLLLARRGAPSAPLWRGAAMAVPGFVLNLAAFHDPDAGFDGAGFAAAAEAATVALTLLAPGAARIAISVADLAGLLAALGLDYDSAAARDVGAAIAAVLRGASETASAKLAGCFGALAIGPAAAPPPPAATAVAGLAEFAAMVQLRAAADPARRHLATTGIAVPGAVEALLGVETGGIAPAFSPLDDAGHLTRTARAALAARAMTAETALAGLLAGHSPFAAADAAAHAAMHDAVAPFVQMLPVRPTLPVAAPPVLSRRRDLPARHAGAMQKASVGGQKLFLRTGEHADGTLGEIAITLPKETAAVRGLLDAFSQAVSLGLQHGVPLEDFVDAFIHTRFGPSGAVEGDAVVTRASSVLDYVFRSLAAHYLGRTDLPEPAAEDEAPSTATAPLLPLDLPHDAAQTRRRGLRLVK